jgi:magnesium transporter
MPAFYKHVQGGPGAAPGIEHEEIAALPSGPGKVHVTCMDYCAGECVEQQVDDIEDFINRHRPERVAVRWIDVDGLSDMGVVHTLATKYELHPLAVEDLLNLHDRPKVEPYGGEGTGIRARLFIVARTLELTEGRLISKQISIFLGHNTVLTFRETPGSEWDHVRQRVRAAGSRLRHSDASFLVHSLLDAIVDTCFPILEHYEERMEEIESTLLEDPQRDSSQRINEIKHDLLLLRWVMWPTRDMVAQLQRDPHECVSDGTRIYLRDLYDHVMQIIEIIEMHREHASGLYDSYMSAVSNRMNQTMKVLTVISTIFIPLTFLAGVYGMTFHFFPELDQPWAYPAFWLVCAALAVGLVAFFRRRQWM